MVGYTNFPVGDEVNKPSRSRDSTTTESERRRRKKGKRERNDDDDDEPHKKKFSVCLFCLSLLPGGRLFHASHTRAGY